MSLILDPTNSADDSGYDGMRILLGLDVSLVSNADIDADPLFQDAEEFIVIVVPASALPTGRTYTDRLRVIRALQFLSTYNFLFGGSDTISIQTAGGTREVKAVSETIGPITKRTEYGEFGGSTNKTITHGVDNRSEYFLQSAYRILLSINPDFKIPAHHGGVLGGGSIPVEAATTNSKEVELDDFLYYLERTRLNQRTP